MHFLDLGCIWWHVTDSLLTDTDAAACWILPVGGWPPQASVDIPNILPFILHLLHPGLLSILQFLFFAILSNHLTDQSLWYILTSDNALNPREWLMGAPGAFAKWVCGSDISIHHTKGTSNICASNLAKCLPSTWYHAGEVGECSHTGSDGHWLPCSGLCLILTISSSDFL